MSEKNLLIISNNFPNRDNTYVGDVFVKEQVKSLRGYFDTVYVVSPVAYGMEHLRKTKHFNYQFDNVKVFFPKYVNNPILWYFGRSMWVDLETRAIISLIESEDLRFDLIHAHFTWPSGAVATRLRDIYKVPIVITEHTSVSLNKAIISHDSFWINSWKKADAIIRVKRGDIPLIESTGVPKSKIVHIPNGYGPNFTPMETLKCRKLLGLPPDLKIILCVGNLYSSAKGHKYFIEAFELVARNRTDIYGVIIGSGKLESSIRSLISKLQLDEQMHLVGGKPHDEIPLWLNACDLFVLPSLSESFGVVLIEAMACGKPVVATRNGGSEEIITSEEYGLLVEPGNSNDLARKIQMALNREWDLDAIRCYTERYTWNNVAQEIMELYKKLKD